MSTTIDPHTARRAPTRRHWLRHAAAGLGAGALPAAALWLPRHAHAASLAFETREVRDPASGLRVGTLQVPRGWALQSSVQWDYTSANNPVAIWGRAQAPDGTMWIEFYPLQATFSLSRILATPPQNGQRMFGAVYAPGATAAQALEHLVVRPARARAPEFRIVSQRPTDARRLLAAFHQPAAPGEALTMRVQYRAAAGGGLAEEDFHAFYSDVIAIPYHGPMGTDHEYHRLLALAHSVGATGGQLAAVYPLLAMLAASVQVDPAFLRHQATVQQQIVKAMNAELQRGYERIAAAGRASRAISAGNDAMLASMQQQRAAQARAPVATASRGTQAFNDYVRGVTRMDDPYGGSTERDSAVRYHWSDGQGNYRASNDIGFDPNVGGAPGQNWQRLQASR